MSVTVQIINSWLRNNAGQQENGQPLFRLVHSAEQLEKRLGTFRDFNSHGLFLREVTEVRQVKKYEYLSDQCYVLERWVPSVINVNYEVMEGGNGTWEPIWCFLTSEGKAIEPSLKAVQFIIHNIFNPKDLTPEQRKAHFDLMEEKEQAEMEDMFNSMAQFRDPNATIGYTKEILNADTPSGTTIN